MLGLLLQGKLSCSESSLSHIPHVLLSAGASETSRKQEQVVLHVMINYSGGSARRHSPSSRHLSSPAAPRLGLPARRHGGVREGVCRTASRAACAMWRWARTRTPSVP